jgi:hypothetical protein
MFEVIDFVVAPLTELNPAKYVVNPDYRSKKRMELGARAQRIFIYWVVVVVIAVSVIGFFLG